MTSMGQLADDCALAVDDAETTALCLRWRSSLGAQSLERASACIAISDEGRGEGRRRGLRGAQGVGVCATRAGTALRSAAKPSSTSTSPRRTPKPIQLRVNANTKSTLLKADKPVNLTCCRCAPKPGSSTSTPPLGEPGNRSKFE